MNLYIEVKVIRIMTSLIERRRTSRNDIRMYEAAEMSPHCRQVPAVR